MALDLENEYTNTNPADASYPQGSFKNISAPGLLDGTPFEKAWPNDIYGFLQRLLLEAGVTPSGSPDTVLASDYYDALYDSRLKRDIPVGALIEHYGQNPDTDIYAESGDVVDSTNYPLIKSIVNPALSFTTRTPAGGFSGTFRGVATNGSLFVAVGTGGEIQTSPDGITWTQRTAAGGYSFDFLTVHYGNGLFVAGGATGGEIQTSPDGITWTQRTTTGGGFNAGVYTNSLHIMVGSSGGIHTSPDGITWTQRTAAGSYTGAFRGVAGDDSTIVIVGDTGEIQTSPDGITWTQRTAAGGFASAFEGAEYGNDIFVIAGNLEEIQTSSDGITWTQRNTGGSTTIRNVIFGENVFFFIGGSMLTSVDGITIVTHTAISGGASDAETQGTTLTAVGGVTTKLSTSETKNREIPTFSTSQTGFTQYMCIA